MFIKSIVPFIITLIIVKFFDVFDELNQVIILIYLLVFFLSLCYNLKVLKSFELNILTPNLSMKLIYFRIFIYPLIFKIAET